MRSLFEKFESQYQVQRLAEEFYDVMDRDPAAKELRALHPENLFFTKKTLYRFLVHWSGGPEIFNADLVNSSWLELRHRNVELNEKLQKQWLYCMKTAMHHLNFKKELIDEVLSRFSNLINSMLATRVRTNQSINKDVRD